MKPLWRWLGKQLCCFAFVSCWGVHSQKPIWNLKRKIIFPTPMLGFQLRFLIFFGGVTNYIISEKRSPIHPPMMFWGYGRMADMWSFGCVVLEMGTASSPWGHPGNERVVWILYPIQSMKGQGKIDVIVQEPMMPHGDKISKATRSKHFSVTFGFSLQHYPPETASLGISALSGFQPPRKFDNPMAAMQLARTYQSVNFAAKTDTGWMIAPFVSHHQLHQPRYKIGMSNETPPIPEHFTDLYRSFIHRCLQRDPDERLCVVILSLFGFCLRPCNLGLFVFVLCYFGWFLVPC